MDDLLQQGITAYKAGKRDEARNIFITVVKQSPDSQPAWAWLYDASNNDQERIHCLKQIVRINPNNGKAKQRLNELTAFDFPLESPASQSAPQSVQTATNLESAQSVSSKTKMPDVPMEDASQPKEVPTTNQAQDTVAIDKNLILAIAGIGGILLIASAFIMIFHNMPVSKIQPVAPISYPTKIPPTHTPQPSPTASLFTREPIDFVPVLPDGFYLDKSNEQINKVVGDELRLFSIQYTNKYASTVGDLSGVLFYFNIFSNEPKAISGYKLALVSYENEQKLASLASEEIEIDGTDISTLYVSSPGDKNLLQGSIISRVNNIVLTTVSFTVFDPQAFTKTFFYKFVADITIIHSLTVEKLLQLSGCSSIDVQVWIDQTVPRLNAIDSDFEILNAYPPASYDGYASYAESARQKYYAQLSQKTPTCLANVQELSLEELRLFWKGLEAAANGDGNSLNDHFSRLVEISSQVDEAMQDIELTHAPTVTSTYVPHTATIKTYINLSTGLCLDSNAASAVYTLGCNGGNYQNWESRGKSLVNVSTGFCLDSNAEGKVYAIGCNGGDYQNWNRSDKRLINVATDLCLDSNTNGNVYTLDCNGGNYQNWK